MDSGLSERPPEIGEPQPQRALRDDASTNASGAYRLLRNFGETYSPER